MKKIYIIAIVSAAICGVLLYSFFSGYEKNGEEIVQNEGQKTVQVVVASKDIKPYTEIKNDMLQVVAMPEGTPHANAAQSVEQVVGKITEREIVAGEQILTNKIYEAGKTNNGSSYQIPKGMRAMTINVDIQQDLAGYLAEGDLIDIITGSSQNQKKIVALSAIKILKLGDVAEGGKGKVNANITLLLEPKQCLTLSGISNFSVALREKTDNSK